MEMIASEGTSVESEDVLSTLDRAAGHVIEARALLMTLATDQRSELQLLVDMLLITMARQIAAETPTAVVTPSTAQPDR